MKKLRKISKDYYLRKIVACWLIFCMLVIMPVRFALAADYTLPDGWEVVNGSVGEFDDSTLGDLLIKNIADGTIITVSYTHLRAHET